MSETIHHRLPRQTLSCLPLCGLIVVQISLGALVIDTLLHAVLVAVHLGLGILLFAMTLLTTLFAFRIDVRAPTSGA